jgi:hypothetical protein
MHALVLCLALAVQQLTPQDVIDALRKALDQVQAQVTPPVPVVSTSAGLVAALQTGGSITLAPGTYVGNFVIGQPTTLAGPGAILTPLDTLTPTLACGGAVSDVTVTGISVVSGAPDRDAIVCGDYRATSLAAFPHRITFRSIAIGTTNGYGHRGLAFNVVDGVVDGIAVTGFAEKGRDSQAVWLNGPGPYRIVRSHLEASGENLLVGGADVALVGMNPTDIVIDGNTLTKPDAYRATGATPGTVKNSFELKTGMHVSFTNNVIDGWWQDGQDAPIQITVRNQDWTCTWCQVDDVTIQGTVYTRVGPGFAVNVLGLDNQKNLSTGEVVKSQRLHTLTLDHDFFLGSTKGVQVLNGVDTKLTVTWSTFPSIIGQFLSWSDSNQPHVQTPLVWAHNVHPSGIYGVSGDGTMAMGTASLLQFATVLDFGGNVIEAAAQPVKLPAGSTIVPNGGLAALLAPGTFKLLSGTAGY